LCVCLDIILTPEMFSFTSSRFKTLDDEQKEWWVRARLFDVFVFVEMIPNFGWMPPQADCMWEINIQVNYSHDNHGKWNEASTSLIPNRVINRLIRNEDNYPAHYEPQKASM
jgi:hypothetical protein